MLKNRQNFKHPDWSEDHIMVRSLPRHLIPLICCIACFLVAARSSLAEDSAPSVIQNQMDAKVINVDKYGIYVPNIVFYWDTQMSKQKIAALTSAAERLRNKRATITYSMGGDGAKSKRLVLLDIIPFKEPPVQAGQETPREQAAVQAAGAIVINTDEVSQFIAKCMNATQSKDVNAALACYADKVDYYSKGTVDKDFIRKDKNNYFRQWDTIISSVDGGVELEDTNRDDVKIARFITFFSVENARKSVTGSAENVWRIEKISNALRIVDEKQDIITSETE